MDSDEGNIQKFFKKRTSEHVYRSDDEEEGMESKKKILTNADCHVLEAGQVIFLKFG